MPKHGSFTLFSTAYYFIVQVYVKFSRNIYTFKTQLDMKTHRKLTGIFIFLTAFACENPKPPSASETTLVRLKESWQLWNGDWTKLEPHYADSVVSEEPGSGSPPWRGKAAVMGHIKLFKHVFPDAKGQLQLILVNGKRAASIVLVTGTHEGAMNQPGGEIAPTHKPLSVPVAHLVERTDSNQWISELIFLDHASLWGQLGLYPGPHRAGSKTDSASALVVLAKDDDTEKKNEDTYKKHIEYFNSRDTLAFAEGMADDLIWQELALPEDLNKKATIASFKEFWKSFSDVKLTTTSQWAAGDYVVALGVVVGTNDGDLSMMNLKATNKRLSLPYAEISKFKDGKLVANWLFYDGLGFTSQLGLGQE